MRILGLSAPLKKHLMSSTPGLEKNGGGTQRNWRAVCWETRTYGSVGAFWLSLMRPGWRPNHIRRIEYVPRIKLEAYRLIACAPSIVWHMPRKKVIFVSKCISRFQFFSLVHISIRLSCNYSSAPGNLRRSVDIFKQDLN